MGNESAITREEIVENSKSLFEEQGYNILELSDLARVNNISEKELNKHFNSKEEVFQEVIKEPHCDMNKQIEMCMDREVSAVQILNLFLDAQKSNIMGTDGCFKIATYEYYVNSERDKNRFNLDMKFKKTIDTMHELLKYGIERDEFVDVDMLKTSKNIIFLLEGLRISSILLNLSEEDIDEQAQLIKDFLIKDKIDMNY